MSDTTEIARQRLLGVALAALRDLRNASPQAGRDEAEQVAEVALRALVGIEFGGAGEADAAIVHRMWQVMNGGRPGADGGADDAIHVRHLALVLHHAAHTPGLFGEANARATIGQCAKIDPALASAKPDEMAQLLERIADGGSLAGAVADLLLSTRALGTTATEDRGDVQRRVAKAIDQLKKPVTP